MDIKIMESYDEISQHAKSLILRELQLKKNMFLCAATGDTPTKTYELLKEAYKLQPNLFSQLRLIKLDEWGNIPMDDPNSCESYLKKHLVQPLKISESHYLSFLSNPPNPELECKRIQNGLAKYGPIDICILGVGMNGHLAFNEPSDYVQPNCHITDLSDKSLDHPMAKEMKIKPGYGLTLGMTDILQSKKIVLLINGSHKAAITKEVLSGRISTQVPASFLWLHPDTVCLIGKEVLSG